MFPDEIRHRAVVHYKYFERSLRRVSRVYGVSKSTLQRWVSQAPRCQVRRRKRSTAALTREVQQVMEACISRNPFTTMEDLAREVSVKCKLKRSARTLGRYRTMLRYTRKKAYRTIKHASDHSEKVTEFCRRLSDHSYQDVICIDEAGFYLGDMFRYGYAKRGSRLNVPASRTLRRTKLTLIAAIGAAGVLHYKILTKNCKKEDFVAFVGELPYLPDGTAVVLDNIGFHHSKETVAALQEKGATPLFTPAYSPEFNAIENFFGTIKHLYRKQCPVGSGHDTFDYYTALEHLLDQFRTIDLSKYFNRVECTVKNAIASLSTPGTSNDLIGYRQ